MYVVNTYISVGLLDLAVQDVATALPFEGTRFVLEVQVPVALQQILGQNVVRHDGEDEVERRVLNRIHCMCRNRSIITV